MSTKKKDVRTGTSFFGEFFGERIEKLMEDLGDN